MSIQELRMFYRNLRSVRVQYRIIILARAPSCHLQPISVVLNRTMRCLNPFVSATLKVTSIYKSQKIMQPKYIYGREVGKFMYRYNKSQLPATFNDYFKFISNVRPYTTSETKTGQFTLPKARSNSENVEYDAIDIAFLDIKNKPCLTLFTALYKKVYYSGTAVGVLPFLLMYIYPSASIL